MTYNRILVATDGSDVAEKAVKHAIDLAKSVGSPLTAVLVTEPYEAVAFTESMVVVDPSAYRKNCEEHAKEVLSKVLADAEAAGVSCDSIHQDSHWPYDGIIKAADQAKADLIVVGSHGRRGIEGLLLGSLAVKLLTHTTIPTLVVR